MAEETQGDSNIHANESSIAIGGISVGGNVGDIRIGHTIGYTSDQVSVLLTQIKAEFQPKPFDGRCPYKGLDVFDEEDAELFFGREKLVEDLVSRLKDSRTLFVTGPSGSGKSSLVRAGLIHALKVGALKNSEHWLYETIKPTREPFIELARVASSFAGALNAGEDIRTKGLSDATVLTQWCEIALKDGRDRRAVIFIDQFEEVFTQISREEERVAFLNLLTHAATVTNGRVILLFSMRSDFVSNCATYSHLNALLNQQFLQIGAMQPDELVSAMAQPALRVGLRIEPDLIAQIINDMKGEPGALPLMQFALKDLFDEEQAKGGIIALTLNDYFQRGGIQKSLERHADAAFAKLGKDEQEFARSIFSGLIEIGHGTQDTRRTALLDELIPSNIKAENVEAIVRKLADARLITTDEQAGKDTITISHEKLIDAWPWLRKLVNENRDVIALQNEIASDAQEWEEHQRDPSYLYSGTRLATAQEKLKNLTLNENTRAYLNACVDIREREKRAKRVRIITTSAIAVAALILISTISTLAVTGQMARLIYRPLPMEWVVIPEGNFLMGTSDSELAEAFAICPSCDITNEQPQHVVYLDAFQIGKFEVSNKQYYRCILSGVCNRPTNTSYDKPESQNYPVADVNWKDASVFCEWNGGRLPTEAEWEKAARGHMVNLENTRLYPWGTQWDPQKANVDQGENGAAMTIGNYSPIGDSVYGVSDMAGNMWEWVADWYDKSYYAVTPSENPIGPETGTYKVLRGGSFGNSIVNARSTYRAYTDLNNVSIDVGFRCAK